MTTDRGEPPSPEANKLQQGRGKANLTVVGSAMLLVDGEGVVARQLAVFANRPRNPRDAIPATAADVMRAMVSSLNSDPNATGPGELHLQQSRLLLERPNVSIHGAPTSNGWVCYASSDGYMGNCVHSLIDNIIWQAQYVRADEKDEIYLHGLVSDQVVSVDIVNRQGKERAELGRNAFYYERTGQGMSTGEISAIFLALRDGSSKLVPMNQ